MSSSRSSARPPRYLPAHCARSVIRSKSFWLSASRAQMMVFRHRMTSAEMGAKSMARACTRHACEERSLWHYDTRRCVWRWKCCRAGYWSRLRAAPPSGVFEISTPAGPGVSRRCPLALGDGQLGHAHVSQRRSLDHMASARHPSRCADQFQLTLSR
jgi:hypothetical protein